MPLAPSPHAKRYAQAICDVAHGTIVEVPARYRQIARWILPGGATYHTGWARRAKPGGAIGRCTRIVVVPAILGPLGNTAQHAIEAPGIGGELSDVGWARGIVGPAAAIAVGFGDTDVSTPGVTGLCASPCRILPFGLGQESIGLAGSRGQPAHVFVGVVPAQVCHGPFGRSCRPARLVPASAAGGAGYPFGLGCFELANGKGSDSDAMTRLLGGIAIGSHDVSAARDLHHDRATLAILELALTCRARGRVRWD